MDIPKLVLAGVVAGGVGGVLLVPALLFANLSFGVAYAVVVVCCVAGAAALHVKSTVARLVEDRCGTLRRRVEHLHRQVGDIHGMVRLVPYSERLPLPLGGGWALTGDSAAILAREVLLRRPRAVVELGSGASTLLIGQILQRSGAGKLLAIDHDAQWAAQTRRNVEFLGLGEYVDVVHAPLEPMELDGRVYDWYAIPGGSLGSLGTIDFLFVDGPPQGAASWPTRYPAFPLLKNRLSDRACVFVDDASRQSERLMVERWTTSNPGWTTQHFDTVDGVCLLSRANAPVAREVG